MPDRYDGPALQRRVDEPAKRSSTGANGRSDFQRDRARVLHSYAFRRLADKTQVVVPGEDDFPRTRLTHSLEVAQIGRELGEALGCDPDVVDAAGLAHDLGHPPFGHNGEDALDAVASGIGGFEGNAQTLRILTRLEPKVIGPDGEPAGLNLTRATLDAVCKYPWPRRDGERKFGAYDDDLGAFDWIRDAAPATDARCLEAQVMDWADDVAYSVHDVEDGVHAGLIRLGDVDADDRVGLCELAAELYSDHPAGELAPMLDRLLELPTMRDLADYDGSFAAQAAAKSATSELTGRFVEAAIRATKQLHPDPVARYAAGLSVPDAIRQECALLKAIAVRYVMRRPGTVERQAAQRRLLTELVSAVADGAPDTLDPVLTGFWHKADGDAARMRIVIDQVAQLTDTSAAAWHRRLCRAD